MCGLVRCFGVLGNGGGGLRYVFEEAAPGYVQPRGRNADTADCFISMMVVVVVVVL